MVGTVETNSVCKTNTAERQSDPGTLARMATQSVDIPHHEVALASIKPGYGLVISAECIKI